MASWEGCETLPDPARRERDATTVALKISAPQSDAVQTDVGPCSPTFGKGRQRWGTLDGWCYSGKQAP
jgi:hypothetical protein